jgi:hypothetical protein
VSASSHRLHSRSWYRLLSVHFAAPIPISTSRSRRPIRHRSLPAYARERSTQRSCCQVAAGTGELQARRLSEEPIMVALPKRHRAAAFEQVDLALLKDDPFFVFPPEIAPTLYDTVVDACRKAGFEPLRADHRPARTAHGVDRESRGRRAWRIDPSGVDDASARNGHRLSANCRPVADDPACSRLPARSDVAGGAQLHRAGGFPRTALISTKVC